MIVALSARPGTQHAPYPDSWQALTELGAVNYAVARYASDYRQRGAWGMFRHEMRHGLLIEGSVPPRPAAKPLRR